LRRFVNANLTPELADHLAESVRSTRRRYRRRLELCQEKFSEKAVHDLRVETRRLLALLDLLCALRFDDSLADLRKAFKKRLEALGDLRDTQVQRQLLKPLWEKFPEARPFKKYLRKCEEQLDVVAARKIGKSKFGSLNKRLKEIEQGLRSCASRTPGTGSPGPQQTLLNAAYRRVLLLRRQVQKSKPATIHRLRIAFKRFRYTAELLQPVLRGITPQTLQRMKDFQDAAGSIQDLAVLLARIEAAVQSEKVAPTDVKRLRQELAQCERRATDSWMKRMDELRNFAPAESTRISFEPEGTTR